MTAQPNSSSAAKGMDDTLRKFSETSKQQLQTLRSRLGQNPPVGDDMRAVLNRIWSEASFLGCPAIARLSRSLMPATSSTPDEAGQETIRAVSDALDALEELLDDPSSPALVETSENCRWCSRVWPPASTGQPNCLAFRRCPICAATSPSGGPATSITPMSTSIPAMRSTEWSGAVAKKPGSFPRSLPPLRTWPKRLTKSGRLTN